MEGAELHRQRVSKLLTCGELALLSGVPEVMIENYESGYIKPDKKTLEELIEALKNWRGMDD